MARIRTLKPEFATDEKLAPRQLGACSPLRRRVWERDKGRCVLCHVECKRQKDNRYDSAPNLGEIDHILPVCLGGRNTLENLRLLCLRCNRCKGTRHPEALSCAI